jgi:hypothetical protein
MLPTTDEPEKGKQQRKMAQYKSSINKAWGSGQAQAYTGYELY